MEVEPTQSGIVKALRRWSTLRQKKKRIESERDQAIAPLRAAFESRCAPFHTKANAELEPLDTALRKLEASITQAMLVAVQERGDLRVTTVSTACAIAEVMTREERELDPKLFFESVPASERNAAFWSCLKTLIGKAEKFLGAPRLNTMVHGKKNYRVQINEL